MPGAAFQDITGALKEFYVGPLNDQVYKAHVMLDRIEKNSEDVAGSYAYVPVISARNPGVGSRQDTSGSGPTLPIAGRQSYSQLTFPMAYHYGRGQVSGPAMRATDKSAGAFAKIMDTEMKGLSETLPESLNKMIWSYGHGRAATLAANVTSSGTIFLANKYANFNLRVGDRIHIDDITAGGSWDPAAGTTVAAIIFDSTTIAHQVETANTLAAATIAADAVYYGGAGTLAAVDSSRAQEMYGIPALIDDGDVGADEGLGDGATTVPAEDGEFINGDASAFGGIQRGSNAWLQSTVLAGSTPGTNRQLTNSLLQQAWLTAVSNGANSKSLEIFCNPGLWATWGLLHIGDRRFNDTVDTAEGGWEFLKYNGTKVFYDRDCPRYVIWFLDMNQIMLLTQGGYQFMEEDGSALHRVSGVDAYEFTLLRDTQMGLRNGNRHVKLKDIEQDVNINID